jgi:hypothetical protein
MQRPNHGQEVFDTRILSRQTVDGVCDGGEREDCDSEQAQHYAAPEHSQTAPILSNSP